MITEAKSYAHNKTVSEFYGLSSDEKPLNVDNASLFYEMDTGKIFMFDEENAVWLEQ